MPHRDASAGFDRIVEYLRQARGFDFTPYKPTSLMRRIRQRMQAVGIEDYDAYLNHLHLDAGEFVALFNTILINVTSFFRDAEVWETLRDRVLPNLATVRSGLGPIRVWSAGCASGQEAYSAAIILAEVLGADAFRERVKIYATDVDEEALAEARRAVYTAKQVADVPPPLLEKYFTSWNGGDLHAIDRDLRRSVIVGRHDLIHDAPISRIDLIFCRNTLMYFNADAQVRIVARLAFSLSPGGHLTLGRAETLFGHASMFEPVDLKHRIFKSVPGRNQREAQRPKIARVPEAAYEASQLTNDQLETTIEELRSMVEELEMTNEALQSANEELEAMTEELQATNQKLQTAYDELRNRSAALSAGRASIDR